MDVLLTALQNSALYSHPVQRFQVIETHISWVLLTGLYAYKIKKPVNLGFLDFSTLEKRHYFCQEELRLNRRLAPHIYLEVVSLTGTTSQPAFNGEGPAFEYAVKMLQFDQAAQMDRMLDRGELSLLHMDQLAQVVAQFHANIARAKADSSLGTPSRIREPVMENFSQIRSLYTTNSLLLKNLEQWCEMEFHQHEQDLWQRKQAGFIRECHGDMHLRNMAVDNNRILIFDGIEFSDKLRWIDVMSEIAFVVMDLHGRQQHAMAARFLNRYLEVTGDYSGLSILRYYLVYRAMVRAKVDCIRAHQTELKPSDKQQILQEFQSYLTLAQRYTQPPSAGLIITYGLSGSGKTRYTQALLERGDFIRLRSDIERKRLFGLTSTAASGSAVDKGIYTPGASQQTYDHLRQQAGDLLRNGWQVIVDATFIHAEQRNAFALLAQQLQVPFVILDFQASVSTLQQRIQSRSSQRSDASEADLAVLEHQRTQQQPLSRIELTQSIRIDTDLESVPEATVDDHLLNELNKRFKLH